MAEEIDAELLAIKKKNEEKYARAQAKAAKAAAAAQAAQDEAERLAQLEAEEIQKFNEEKAAKLSALAEEKKIKEEELKSLDESMEYEAKVAPIRIVHKDWNRKFELLKPAEIKKYIKRCIFYYPVTLYCLW